MYGVALAHLLDLDSWAYFSDVLLHRIVPVVAVLGWLIYEPRGLTSRRIAALTMLLPTGYTVFALIRGAIDRWYPYPFADANSLGYGRVVVNAVWISVLFFAFAMGAHALDQALPRSANGHRLQLRHRDPARTAQVLGRGKLGGADAGVAQSGRATAF